MYIQIIVAGFGRILDILVYRSGNEGERERERERTRESGKVFVLRVLG